MNCTIVLKIVSALCLIFIALTFLLISFVILMNGNLVQRDIMFFTVGAIPAIIALVTAFKQFSKKQPVLVSLMIGLIVAGNIGLYILLLEPSVEAGELNRKLQEIDMTKIDSLRPLPLPPLSMWESIKITGPLYLAMIIPFYLNFRKQCE